MKTIIITSCSKSKVIEKIKTGELHELGKILLKKLLTNRAILTNKDLQVIKLVLEKDLANIEKEHFNSIEYNTDLSLWQQLLNF